MTKVIAKTYSLTSEYSKHLSVVLVSACLFITFIYVLNVYTLVSQTVALQNINKQISELSLSVDTLDAEYLNLSSNITPDSLSAHGMVQGKVSQYIFRPATLTRVALGGHGL